MWSMESIGAERKRDKVQRARACREEKEWESWELRASTEQVLPHVEVIHINTILWSGIFWRVWVMDPKGIHLAFPLYRDSATRNKVERGVLNLNQLRSCFRTVNFQSLGIRLHPTCNVDGVTCSKTHQAFNRWVPILRIFKGKVALVSTVTCFSSVLALWNACTEITTMAANLGRKSKNRKSCGDDDGQICYIFIRN